MALAAPPDLSDHAVPVQPLARTYPRGLYVEPHRHDWGQLLYAMSGVMWVETPREALVVPPQRAVWLPPGWSMGFAWFPIYRCAISTCARHWRQRWTARFR